jgi:hypothetical protein
MGYPLKQGMVRTTYVITQDARDKLMLAKNHLGVNMSTLLSMCVEKYLGPVLDDIISGEIAKLEDLRKKLGR